MALRAVFAYENLDSTADLNLRFEKVISRGVFFGGDIVANGTTNTVTVQAFRASTQDGMVAIDTATTEIVVPGNQKSYLCLLAKYNAPNAPQLSWIVHTSATYQADPNKLFLIVFGTVDLSASAGPVFSNLVSYQERDVVTAVGRDSYLGSYPDVTSLQVAYPTTAPVKQKHNDFALAASGISGLPTWYRWNSTAGAFQAFASYQNEVATFNDHIADSTIHVTPGQDAALAGTFGTPSAGNRYVTENDTTRTLSTDERAAVTNAVGLDTGLSASNPLVADHLPVVGHVLIQKVADGNNVIAINTTMFGDLNAVLYVGRQGIDANGKSSACQYFSIEDLFGDGLAPVIAGVESPITITNINWLNTTGATFNPTTTNAQVDANGFLTLNPGQNLYLNINIAVPSATQYNVRMNVKARMRDLVPSWHNPTTYPAIAAATAFRNGRQPYVLANTGDFKSFRIGDPTKANVFISADQTGYPNYGNVKFMFYSGAPVVGNLKGGIIVGCGNSPTIGFLSSSIAFYNGLDTGYVNVVLNMVGDTGIYASRDFIVVPSGAQPSETRSPSFLIDHNTGVTKSVSTTNVNFGSNPSYSFISGDSNGLGFIPEFTATDPGGTVTYLNSVHVRSGSSLISGEKHFDLVMLSHPDSDNDIVAQASGSALALYKSTSASTASATYALWGHSYYGGSINTVVGIAVNSGRSPNLTLAVGPVGFFTVSGVDSQGHAVKVTEHTLFSKNITVEAVAQFGGSIKSYAGLNSTSVPSYLMRVNDGSLVNASAFTPYNGAKLRKNTDTTYGLMMYAADTSGVLRESFMFGVSDAQLLGSASTYGSVRLGTLGYQLMWDKETISSPVSSLLVIEESNTASRDLMIGRRAASGGAFYYSTAIRIREGVLSLPYINENAPIINFGAGYSVSIGNSSLRLTNGANSVSIYGDSVALGAVNDQSTLNFHTYGRQTMTSTGWNLQAGTHVNDMLLFTGAEGSYALLPGVTGVTDVGTSALKFRNAYFVNSNATTATANTVFVATAILPTLDTVTVGGNSNYMRQVYSHEVTTDSFKLESSAVGGVDAIYPKTDGVGVLGVVGHMFSDVRSIALHGGGFYPNNGNSVVGSDTTPFNVGYFNNVHYKSKHSRMYYQYINTNPTDPATASVDIDLTSGDNEYDEIFLDFFFVGGTSTIPFTAERTPDPASGTKCWIELPNAANYYDTNGNREITITVRTKIGGTLNHYLGIGVDKVVPNNVRVVRLKDDGIAGWVTQIHTLKFRAMSSVDTGGGVLNLDHAGWNCTGYSTAELNNTYASF